jgi:uncharacterized protein YndB with AHSA1/START domain
MIREGRIEHEIVYPHARWRVWRALIDPTELGIWLMPNDFVAEIGRRFTFDARPALGWVAGEVLEVDPPRLLRCRWSGVFGDTVVEFELTPIAEGTRLRLEHRGWDAQHHSDRDGFDGGWHDKLSSDLPALFAAHPHEKATST